MTSNQADTSKGKAGQLFISLCKFWGQVYFVGLTARAGTAARFLFASSVLL